MIIIGMKEMFALGLRTVDERAAKWRWRQGRRRCMAVDDTRDVNGETGKQRWGLLLNQVFRKSHA